MIDFPLLPPFIEFFLGKTRLRDSKRIMPQRLEDKTSVIDLEILLSATRSYFFFSCCIWG